MKAKRIAVLGSTGSIGRQTLEVVDESPHLQVQLLSGHGNVALLSEQIIKYRPAAVIVTHPEAYHRVRESHGDQVQVFGDWDEILSLLEQVDTVVAAISGAAGIPSTLAALDLGKTVALANKETMVAAGDLVATSLERNGGRIIPVDSEHSAIYQCLEKDNPPDKLILTASGGPFRDLDRDSFHDIRVADALAHPNWSMGQKITIDSATLMNKGLEVIEAHRLFHVAYDDIEVLIHPQSAIHSLVQFVDGSILAQLGSADMRLPIQYALNNTRRLTNSFKRLDLAEVASLTFETPRWADFPALSVAYEAGRAGGSAPAVMNAANEVAVEAFLEGRIAFLDIIPVVSSVLDAHQIEDVRSLEQLMHLDNLARTDAREVIAKKVLVCGRS